MCHALCLQPWVTVAGTSGTLVQAEPLWADLSGFGAAGIYVEVASVSNSSVTTTIDLQSSPNKDDFFFSSAGAVATYTFAASPTLGVQALQFVAIETFDDGNAVPLARYLRWAVTFGGAATEITFRIWLSLKQAGW